VADVPHPAAIRNVATCILRGTWTQPTTAASSTSPSASRRRGSACSG